jgi:hypothetical protein
MVTRIMQLAGIQQGYALFNWVDERNHHVVTEAVIRAGDGASRPLPMSALWPGSMRADLMLSYLIGRDWMPLADASRDDFNAAVRARTASRFCAARPVRASVTVRAKITRTLPDVPSEPSRVVPLFRFGCKEDGSFEVYETEERQAQNLK